MKMNNSWTIAEGIVRPTVVLCRVRLAGFSMEFLFDSLEMEERKLSVSTNGSPSGYIYGGMDFLPFRPTYFSAFLFGEVSQHSIWRSSTVLCRYVHFFWIQNTWTQSMKKTKKKSTGPRNKWKDKINVHFYNKHSDQTNTNLYGTNHTSQYDNFTPQGKNRNYQLYVFLERD